MSPNVHRKQNKQEKLLLSMQVFQMESWEGREEEIQNIKKFVLLQYIWHKGKNKYKYF